VSIVAALILVAAGVQQGQTAATRQTVQGLTLVVAVLLLIAVFRRYRRLMNEVTMSLHRTCCTCDIAINYDGWYGTIHTFHFASPTYASAFAAANGRKCVS